MENIAPNPKDIESALRTLIRAIGEDPDREGLQGTPDRIMRMWKEIFRGYDPSQKPKITTFANEDHTTDIVFDAGDYYSMCEHHILPFFGKYYFAYIPAPDGRILGISKVARVVGYCAARLQLQERLAADIVKMLTEALDGKVLGMALVMKGLTPIANSPTKRAPGSVSKTALRASGALPSWSMILSSLKVSFTFS